MNFIPHLTSSSAIFQTATIEQAVYFYILAITTVDDGGTKLVCKYDIKELPKQFKYLDPSLIKEALVSLNKEGLIIIRKATGTIEVGVSRKGYHTIFTKDGEDDSSIGEYRAMLQEAVEYHESIAGGSSLGVAQDNLDLAEKLLAKPLIEWMPREYQDLYRCCYTALYQVECRSLTAKERGQIGHLPKMYDAETAFKMIIQYVFHSDKYHKPEASMGLFLYYKDAVFADVSKLKKEKTKISKLNVKKTEDYFS